MSLDLLLAAADTLRDPTEAVGIIVLHHAQASVVKVVVGREVVAHVEAPSRELAVARAVEALQVSAEAQSGQCAFAAAAGGW